MAVKKKQAKKKRGYEAEKTPRIAAMLKAQPLLSLAEIAEICGASKQYAFVVLCSTPGLREQRAEAKEKLIEKLKASPLGYIGSYNED